MRRSGELSAAQQTAAVLREEILASGEDGRFLGSEEELLTRLGVSRPTLRQAARILEHEQLLSVRRGVNGGLFGRLPTSEAVAHIASVFLRSQGTTITDLMRAVGALSGELARMAAMNAPPAARARLEDWVTAYQARDRAEEQRWFLETSLEFGKRLAALTDNVPLTLFYDVLVELALTPFGVRVFADPVRIDATRAYHRRLAAAIRAGDADAAFAASQEQTARALGWLGHDVAAGRGEP